MAVSTEKKLVNIKQLNSGLVAANNKVAKLAETTANTINGIQDKIIEIIYAMTGVKATHVYFEFNIARSYVIDDIVIYTDSSNIKHIMRCNTAHVGTANSFNGLYFDNIKLYSEQEIYDIARYKLNASATKKVYDIVFSESTNSATENYWFSNSECPGYNYKTSIYCSLIKLDSVPIMWLADKESQIIADDICLCPIIRTANNYIALFSKKIPSKPLRFKLFLVNNTYNGTENTTPDATAHYKEQDNYFSYPTMIQLPISGWVSDSTIVENGVKYTYTDSNIKEDMILNCIVKDTESQMAELIELSPITLIEDGSITFYAKSAPSQILNLQMICINYSNGSLAVGSTFYYSSNRKRHYFKNFEDISDLILTNDVLHYYYSMDNLKYSEDSYVHYILTPEMYNLSEEVYVARYNPVLNGSIKLGTLQRKALESNSSLYLAGTVVFLNSTF